MSIKLKLVKMMIISIAPSIIFGAGLWLAGNAFAASYSYPGQSANGDVSIFGPNSILQAPESDFVFSANQDFRGALTITVNCWDSTAGVPGLSMTVSALRGSPNPNIATANGDPTTKNSSCNNPAGGSPNQTSIHVCMNPTYDDKAEYVSPNQLETGLLVVKRAAGQEGHQGFTITVSDYSTTDCGGNGNSGNPLISYKGDPDPSKPSFSQNTTGYAIWISGNGQPPNSGSYNFTFTPTCNYDTSKGIYLKWSGANVGVTDSYHHLIQPDYPDAPGPDPPGSQYPPEPPLTSVNQNITATLTEHDFGDSNTRILWQARGLALGSGSPVVGVPGVFDSSQPGFEVTSDYDSTRNPNNWSNTSLYDASPAGIPISLHHYYTWSWKNVDPTNPIYLQVPFSSNVEASGAVDPCGGNPSNQTPIGAFTESCATSTYTIIGEDPDHPNQSVQYQVRYDNASGGVDFSGTTNKNGISGSHAFTSGRTYLLMVQDIDNGQWYQTDPASSTCGMGQPSVSVGCYNTTIDLSGDTTNRIYVDISGTDHNVGGTPSDITNSGYLVKNNTPGPAGGFNYNPKPGVTVTTDTQSRTHTASGYGSWGSDNIQTYPLNCLSGTTLTPSGTCSLAVTNGDPALPANSVDAGQPINVNVTITSTGQVDLPQTMDGINLGLTNNGSTIPGAPSPVLTTFSSGVGSASPVTFPFSLPAVSTPGQYTLNGYPDYNSYAAVGPACQIVINVYQSFHITPSASFNGTNWENPTAISYQTSGSLDSGGPPSGIPATANSCLTYEPSGNPGSTDCSTPSSIIDGTHSNSHTYGSFSDPFGPVTNPKSINLGDTYCADVSIFPGQGLYSPGLPVVNAQPTTAWNCQNVTNEPYVHFFNSDVTAGGGFADSGGNCSNSGSIYTYTSTVGTQPAGSAAQYAALSIGQIEGLSSAFLRGLYNPVTAPTASLGLTFANSLGGAPDSANAQGGPDGGNFAQSNYCTPNYFKDKWDNLTAPDTADFSMTPGSIIAGPGQGSETTPSAPTRINANGATDIQEYYKPSNPSHTLTINSQTNFPDTTNESIFVDGNVYISGDLTYGSTVWSTIKEIPSLYIIATGNIYIDNNVSELDGVYVAQPDSSGTGGKIDTCATATLQPLGGTNLFGSNNLCGHQLQVYGAFVAQNIFLNRSYSSLRYSQPGEETQAPYHSCGNGLDISQDPAKVGSPEPDCAAEIFNFSPELYLAQPALNSTSTGRFDDITSLSPVL